MLWKKTGINPMTFDGSDDAHDFQGKLFKIILLIEFLMIGIYCFGGEWYTYLLPIWYLENENLKIFGWILLHISLIWIFIAQLQMKESWRIGIDKKNKTELVTHGLFQFSRNPIFLGIIIADIGFLFVIPNAISFLILALSFVAIQTHIRLEESFLKKSFGRAYWEYCERVGRWV